MFNVSELPRHCKLPNVSEEGNQMLGEVAYCCKSKVGYTPAWISIVHFSSLIAWIVAFNAVISFAASTGVSFSESSKFRTEVVVGVAPTERTCQGILLVDGPTNRGPSSPCT
jgi:hypothetical protein